MSLGKWHWHTMANLFDVMPVKSLSLHHPLPIIMQVLYHHETLVTAPKVPLEGVLFVLTSCDTFVLEWGFASPSCMHCMGKPHRLYCMSLSTHMSTPF